MPITRPLTDQEFARGLSLLQMPPLDAIRDAVPQPGTYYVTFQYPPTAEQLARLAKAGVRYLRHQRSETEYMMCLRQLPRVPD